MPNFPTAPELLRQLIAVPSINPEGDETDGVGEERCAQFVASLLEDLGAEVVLEEVLPGRPNVIGRFPSQGRNKLRILLAPHTDTVGVRHMTVDPFAGELRDGRIYGRGASDTKGTMAAMLRALHELGDRLPQLPCEITFAGFMGEETAQHGSKHFAQRYPDHDFAIVGEPTGLDVVYVHKGFVWFELNTHGRAAHGSTPEKGVNAIQDMARRIVRIEDEIDERLRPYAHPLLGPCTVNLGMVRGGHRANIVPDSCTAIVDLRTTPALCRAGALETFLALFGDDAPSHRVLGSCEPLETDPKHPCVLTLQKLGARLAGAPWFCDAARLAAAGIPSVAAGPGSIAQAHTADEWIEVDGLERGVDFYRTFLEAC
ncbi:MAG TPA: M20 family metallopeptidase [Verrucomicrobiales bacterium]|nr:M20 family metallopeptidase [Verrucomicrobiales bacterium]